MLARLPFLVLLVCVVIIMKHPVRAENVPEPPDDADEEADVSLVISSCDDLPDERTEVFGIVRVVGDIICSENRVSNTSNSRCFLLWYVGLFSVTVNIVLGTHLFVIKTPHFWKVPLMGCPHLSQGGLLLIVDWYCRSLSIPACLSDYEANLFLSCSDRVKHRHSNQNLADNQATSGPKLESQTTAACRWSVLQGTPGAKTSI